MSMYQRCAGKLHEAAGCSIADKQCCVSCAAVCHRVLEQLIEARTAQQTTTTQLASKTSQVQQLVADRDLALQKLCCSEEQLVALEMQLAAMERELQQKQEVLAAQVAALDVAALTSGPLAGKRGGGG